MSNRELTPLSGALDMIRRGYAVFPLRPGIKKPFERENCPPDLVLLAGGINIATRNPKLVERWHAMCPDINFGVSGKGLGILDVDVKENGVAAAQADVQSLDPCPPTLTIKTPSGGLHAYYSASPSVGQRKPQGCENIDVRADGGYVVCPGSWFEGKQYSIQKDCPVAPLPDHIRAKLTAAPPPRDKQADKVLCELDDPQMIAHCTLILKEYPSEAEGGGRNNKAYFLACILRDHGISEETSVELIGDHWNEGNDPPLEDEELRDAVRHAWEYARKPAGALHPSVQFGDIIIAPEIDAEAEPIDILGGDKLTPDPVLTRDMVPAVLADFVWDTAERLGVEPGLVLGPALTACATALTDEVKIQPKQFDDRWQESARLWFPVVADFGVAKSPSIREANRPLAEVEKAWRAEDAPKLARYHAQAKRRKPDEEPELTRPPSRRVIVNDFTMEAAGPDPGGQQARRPRRRR